MSKTPVSFLAGGGAHLPRQLPEVQGAGCVAGDRADDAQVGQVQRRLGVQLLPGLAAYKQGGNGLGSGQQQSKWQALLGQPAQVRALLMAAGRPSALSTVAGHGRRKWAGRWGARWGRAGGGRGPQAQRAAGSPSLRAATRSLKYCASCTISSALRISWLRSVNAWSTVLQGQAGLGVGSQGGGAGQDRGIARATRAARLAGQLEVAAEHWQGPARQHGAGKRQAIRGAGQARLGAKLAERPWCPKLNTGRRRGPEKWRQRTPPEPTSQ